MRLVLTLIVWLAVVPGVAVAAPALTLRIDKDRVEATVTGAAPRDSVFLRVVDADRRVPALSVQPPSSGGEPFVASFDLLALPNDGKTHELALEVGDAEVARASLQLPAMTAPSPLRWLVIVGPLSGVVLIAASFFVWRLRVGRRRAAP